MYLQTHIQVHHLLIIVVFIIQTKQHQVQVMVSLTITDVESDTPFSMSLSGTDASKFNIVPQNSNTSSVQLTASDFGWWNLFIYCINF